MTHFSILVWAHCKQNNSAFNMKLHHYHSSKKAVARVIQVQCISNNTWGQNDGWGQDDDMWDKQDDGTQSGSALGWDANATQPTLGWETTPETPQVDPRFLAPQRLSGQNTPDGNWEKDQFNFLDPIPNPVPPPPPIPPSLSTFLQDIRTYFRRHEASSTRSIGGTSRPNSGTSSEVQNDSTSSNDGAVRSNGRTTRSNAGSATFESWLKKQKFNHIYNIVRDSDVQKHVVTCLPGVTLHNPAKQISLHRDWGSNISTIALKLLHKGITFKTLQPMAVSPEARHLLSELHTFLLRYFWPPFKAIYADYIAYEQYRHEFMNEDCVRPALLCGGVL
ncbi:hypothetical protein C8R48DRAFT_674910 [Suillus tomentosus]|nr:hypothetical protein C8R48DRAFT_674910 [Suillus tomentosus]